MRWGDYPEYVPVAVRRARAQRELQRLRKRGKTIEPIEIEGRVIARSFWGAAWCRHLESFSDFANRLPRGRTYARNGSVCHLAVQSGHVESLVSGSELYELDIRITPLPAAAWRALKQRCAGQVGSMLELLQGRLSDQVMAVVTDREAGLFPGPRQIRFGCSCPDFASMCKHVAAVLYGVGHRLDSRPELLFTLRGVDPQTLIATDIELPGAATAPPDAVAEDRLGDIFGIELDTTPAPPRESANKAPRQRARKTPRRRIAKKQAARQISRSTQRTPAAARDLPRLRPTGKSVARLRSMLGWTVAEFAAQAGVSPACVYRWEATPGRLGLQATSLRALTVLHQQATKT